MNKDEFLRKLEALLSGISQEERTEALAFGIRQCRAHRREQQQEQSGIRQCGEQRRTHRREYHREQRRMQRILRRRRMECRDGRSFFWSSLRRCG